MPSFRWEDLDLRLVVLKLIDLSTRMNTLIKADESRIRFKNRLNLISVPPLVLQMKLDRLDEWARETYETYCDVWQTQGHRKSPEFVKAVFGREIVQLFQAREGIIASEFRKSAISTHLPPPLWEAHLRSFELNMQRLRGRWHRFIEIEARESAHQARRVSANVASPGCNQEPAPKKPKLGPKKADLSRYMDSAHLTERQRECFSLVKERGMGESDTARYLGIHHSTVQEYVKAASRKIKRYMEKELSKRNPRKPD